MSILFFDTYTSRNGHTYFYDLNLIKLTQKSGFKCGFCSKFGDNDIVKELLEDNISVYEIETYTEFNINRTAKDSKLNNLKIKLRKNPLIAQIFYRIKGFKNKFHREKIINNVLDIAKRDNFQCVHILDLDTYAGELCKISKDNNLKISGTLHWAPNTKKKQEDFALLVRKEIIDKVVVHGDYIKEKVVELVGNEYEDIFVSIDYPLMPPNKVEKEKALKKLDIDSNYFKPPYILSFGSLRFDKGVDLLLEALKGINLDFTLIIAGMENNFTKKFIDNKIDDYNLGGRVATYIKYIPDDELPYYFSAADIVAVPYRKHFTGQSGPLTEGVNYNCIILGSDIGQIGYSIRQFNLGAAFEAEHADSLNQVLVYLISNYKKIQDDIEKNQIEYKKNNSLENFSQKYMELFQTFISNESCL